MLPLSLRVKNFLSYREDAPTLHLEDVHVACLCGANGHGKSALLDAMTWALWGKARGRTQEQLIHEGQQEMAVELEFEEEGQRYRVVRRYSRARRSGQSSLEISVASQDGWLPTTGNTVRQTESAIERLVNMDYDTFVNSAYLLQGRADLFTMSTPAQRKNVLSSVLGLGLYDRLAERAKLHGRNAQSRLDLEDEILRRLEAQLDGGASVEEHFAAVLEELAKAEEANTTTETEVGLVRQQITHLGRREEEANQLAGQTERVRARRDQAIQESQGLEHRLKGWQSALDRAPHIEQGYGALQDARLRLAEHNSASQHVHGLERALWPLEQAVSAAKAQVMAEVANQERRIGQELEPRVMTLPEIEERLVSLVNESSEQDQASDALSADAGRLQAITAEAQRVNAENELLRVNGQATRGKLEMLAEHDHDNGIACPLCGTKLGGDGRRHLEDAYKAEIGSQLERFEKQKSLAMELSQQAKELESSLAKRQRTFDAERRRLEEERGRLSVQRDEAALAKAQLEQARATLATKQNSLERGTYAPAEQARVAELRQEIASAAFDTHAMEETQRQVDALTVWEEEHQRLNEARSRTGDDTAGLAAALDRVEEGNEELERILDQQTQIASDLERLPSLQEQQWSLDVRLREDAQARDELQARRGSLAHQMQQLSGAKTELEQRRHQRSEIVSAVATYTELAVAFGRGGVQALLIEAAVPRLEDEANALLSRMTDGRMALQMHTQRDRRAPRATDDDLIETLEITINDEIGMRSYEMFSGGERFRIDLALRIALSKLLAWRAGARLPALFIDEGFGTQDAEGRDRIVDVIKAIEDRFQRILVITHMDEVKEAFPVRIEVSRTAGTGSTFSVS